MTDRYSNVWRGADVCDIKIVRQADVDVNIHFNIHVRHVESGQAVGNRVELKVVDIRSLVVGYIRGNGAVERFLDS
jgi:hypothetical protein